MNFVFNLLAISFTLEIFTYHGVIVMYRIRQFHQDMYVYASAQGESPNVVHIHLPYYSGSDD